LHFREIWTERLTDKLCLQEYNELIRKNTTQIYHNSVTLVEYSTFSADFSIMYMDPAKISLEAQGVLLC